MSTMALSLLEVKAFQVVEIAWPEGEKLASGLTIAQNT